LLREIDTREWAGFWLARIISHNELPYKISAQGDQGIKHFLCKLEIWTEFAKWCCAQNLNCGT
jgi:hypothetical protein